MAAERASLRSARRQIIAGHRRENATAAGRPEYYDARTNTIYTVPAGTEIPRRPARPPGERVERVLAGTEDMPRLLEAIRDLLASRHAREGGRVAVGGRGAVRIVVSAARTTLLVDAHTYEPVGGAAATTSGLA